MASLLTAKLQPASTSVHCHAVLYTNAGWQNTKNTISKTLCANRTYGMMMVSVGVQMLQPGHSHATNVRTRDRVRGFHLYRLIYKCSHFSVWTAKKYAIGIQPIGGQVKESVSCVN